MSGVFKDLRVPCLQDGREEVTEAEIDRQIEVLLSYRTSYQDVEEDRGAEADDMVLADVENISNLREYEGENRMFSLGDQRLHEQWREALVGMRKDEEKEVRWTREHEHEDGEVHEIVFAAKVKVNAIRHAVTPELTEDNVKDDFGFDTVEELREAVKEEVAVDKQNTLPRRLVFVIGGPYGFSPQVYERADEQLSLSRLTFSHQMVRLLFVEQIYRALTILKGEPYHHE